MADHGVGGDLKVGLDGDAEASWRGGVILPTGEERRKRCLVVLPHKMKRRIDLFW
jgi:hypothetical protein